MNWDLRPGPEGAACPVSPESPEPMTEFLCRLRENVRIYAAEDQIVQLAWEAAGWTDRLGAGERKAVLLLVLCSLVAVRQGSTRLPVRGPEGRDYLSGVMRQLTGSPEQAAEALDTIDSLLDDQRLRPLVGSADDFRPLVLEGDYLYHQKMHALENRFSQRLLKFANAPAPMVDQPAVDRELSHLEGRPLRLSEEQRSAVRTALLSSFSVITGGPGTGKTSVIASLLRALCGLGVAPEKIGLAAPTGKGANRMAEAILQSLVAGDETDAAVAAIPTPRTLHRLLGYSPPGDRFLHHENNRLPEEVVIVDEASMIDLLLMERLLRSLKDGARLILIGDAEQLPPVEAGAVLRDLVPRIHGCGHSPLAPCTVRLLKNFRMSSEDPGGSEILTFAAQVREGRTEGFADGSADSPRPAAVSVGDVRFRGVEVVAAGAHSELASFLDRWYTLRLRGLPDIDRLVGKEYSWGSRGFSSGDMQDLERLFGHFGSMRILCVTRVYETGSDAVNRVLHAMALRSGGYEFSPDFVPGEPVLMEHNDYARNIFNGDQGIVLRVRDQSGQQRFMAVFRLSEGFGAYLLDSLRGSISRAFAMTVHKSQGSEFDYAALILPRQDMPLLTRELLYTAVTRSRKSLTILGSSRILARAVQTGDCRFSGIAEKLHRPPSVGGPCPGRCPRTVPETSPAPLEGNRLPRRTAPDGGRR